MSSFFSERTAEYALVPALQRLLAPRFGPVTPFFFWKTREGNSTVADQHGQGTYRVIAMFAIRYSALGWMPHPAGRFNPSRQFQTGDCSAATIIELFKLTAAAAA